MEDHTAYVKGQKIEGTLNSEKINLYKCTSLNDNSILRFDVRGYTLSSSYTENNEENTDEENTDENIIENNDSITLNDYDFNGTYFKWKKIRLENFNHLVHLVNNNITYYNIYENENGKFVIYNDEVKGSPSLKKWKISKKLDFEKFNFNDYLDISNEDESWNVINENIFEVSGVISSIIGNSWSGNKIILNNENLYKVDTNTTIDDLPISENGMIPEVGGIYNEDATFRIASMNSSDDSENFIKGDENLLSENILSGVTIFGISGAVIRKEENE